MHRLDEDAPRAVEYVPAEHWMQLLARLAPLTVEYVPASHKVHVPAAVTDVYLPESHKAQALSWLEAHTVPRNDPAAHVRDWQVEHH
jgi:hypothetical protein